MSAARSHGGSDNGHSASIQIDPPAQPIASSATGMPFPLPAHRPIYNDDDEDSDEDGPLLGASSTTRGGRGPRHHQLVDQDDDETGQRRQSGEPAPFLYRLHDWLADHGTSKLALSCFFRQQTKKFKPQSVVLTPTRRCSSVLVVLVILELKSFWSNPRSAKVSLPRWQTVLKWAFILLNVVLVLGLVGLSVRKQQESFSWIFDFFDKKEKVPRVVALRIAKHCSDKNLFLYVQLAPIGVALVRIRGCVRSERQRVGSIAVLVPPWAVQELLLPSWPVHRKSTYPCVSFTPFLFSISQNKAQHLIRQRFIDESAFFSHFFALYFNILTSRLEISLSVSTNRLMRTMEATKSWSTSTQRDLAATLSVPSL